jgi:hypothetical protein
MFIYHFLHFDLMNLLYSKPVEELVQEEQLERLELYSPSIFPKGMSEFSSTFIWHLLIF